MAKKSLSDIDAEIARLEAELSALERGETPAKTEATPDGESESRPEPEKKRGFSLFGRKKDAPAPPPAPRAPELARPAPVPEPRPAPEPRAAEPAAPEPAASSRAPEPTAASRAEIPTEVGGWQRSGRTWRRGEPEAPARPFGYTPIHEAPGAPTVPPEPTKKRTFGFRAFGKKEEAAPAPASPPADAEPKTKKKGLRFFSKK